MNEQPPEKLLLPAPTLPTPDRGHLRTLATRFAAGGCCGKRPTLTLEDLAAAGLMPIPSVYVSTLGQIIPRSGWRAMCVYVYETIVKQPFPPPAQGEEWGTVVADALMKMCEASDHSNERGPDGTQAP